MKKTFLLVACVLSLVAFSPALAHPGVGIVQDSKGNIYYTDLTQVWKIGADGKKTIAVHRVHTHELYIDANDDLYGEHMWYNGERLNTWGFYAWCLRQNGKLDTVEGPKPGFRDEYSFNRDSAGKQYWAERFTISRIKKKTPDGKITTIAEGKFKDIRWMHVTPDGIVYFVDLLDLYRIDKNGNKTMMVQRLAEKPGSLSLDDGRHSIMGIWTDASGNTFAAVASQRTVKKISSNGTVIDAVYSLTPWSPCGGLVDKKGNLWLMEYSITNDVRVRMINAADLQKPPSKIKAVAFNYVLPVSVVASLIILTGMGVKKLLKNRRSVRSS